MDVDPAALVHAVRIADGPQGPFVAWRTHKKIYLSRADGEIRDFSPITGQHLTRAPSIVRGTGSETLLLWSVNAPGLNRGASHIVWQLFDAEGSAVSRKGVIRRGGSPGWGSATAYPTPDGGFVVLYDGEGSAQPEKR